MVTRMTINTSYTKMTNCNGRLSTLHNVCNLFSPFPSFRILSIYLFSKPCHNHVSIAVLLMQCNSISQFSISHQIAAPINELETTK